MNNKKQSDNYHSPNNTGRIKYINHSNITKENSSDNDIENSNLEKEKEFTSQSQNNNIVEKEFRRHTIEYIKVLGLYNKQPKEQTIHLKDIMQEFNIPKEIIEGNKNYIFDSHINLDEVNSNLEHSNESKEEKVNFDNDIQPPPSLSHEMKIVLYLSKPKLIAFNGKLSLFYISPIPVDKNIGYYIVIKNPQDMKVIFKIKIIELITCIKKNEKTLYLQNFGTKILSKNNNEMTFKSGEDCSLVHKGITFLMSNKEEDIFY